MVLQNKNTPIRLRLMAIESRAGFAALMNETKECGAIEALFNLCESENGMLERLADEIEHMQLTED